MNSDFRDYCEKLWYQWIQGTIEYSTFVRSKFQVAYLPEPYLQFGECSNPLYVLTTNPGQGMSVQHQKHILEGKSIVSPNDRYSTIAKVMGNYYQQHLKGVARNRIEAMIELSKKSGFDGVIQIEACPFHSKSLPKKETLLKNLSDDPVLNDYNRLLKHVLFDKTVIAVSAVGTKAPISTGSITNRRWLNWQADLIGLKICDAEMLPIIIKDEKTTSAFIYSRSKKSVSGFVLMMGGNHLPKLESMSPVIEVLDQNNAV